MFVIRHKTQFERRREMWHYNVVASGPRTLEERIELGWDWDQWLVSVEDIKEEERLVAKAKETAKAWVNSLVGDVNIAPK